MQLKEIRELLVLKEWTRETLAERLKITRNTIDRWFCAAESNQRHPSPDHVKLMRAWLVEARRENQAVPV